MMLLAATNPLVPTGTEVVFSLLGLVLMVGWVALLIFGIKVLLTWHRKNKLRTIELEFEERAIDARRARQKESGES